MSSAPKRPWNRTDPDRTFQGEAAATGSSARASAGIGTSAEPKVGLRQQIVAGVDELRHAGALRLGLGAIGIAAILFGAVRILTNPSATKPVHLALWLAAAVVLHDGIAAPVTVVVGYLVARVIRGRLQAYVQAALAVAAMVAVIALPQIYRRGKSAPGTTLLHRNYALNLVIIIGVVVIVTAVAYAITGRRRASSAPDRDATAVSSTGASRGSTASRMSTGQGATSTNERPAHNH